MDDLMPEIEWATFEFSCENDECTSFSVVTLLQAPSGCEEITCGPCSQPITNLLKLNDSDKSLKAEQAFQKVGKMAQSSWPFQGVDTSETQYSRILRHIVGFGRAGVNGVPGDNNLRVIGDSSGMNVKVRVSGGNSQAIIRGHMYNSTAEETLTIDPSSGSPRIDSVVLTLDPTANTILLGVVKGSASATPSAPALTQTDTAVFQFKLADVLVGANVTTISAGAVTDTRQFIENVWTTNTRPSSTTGLVGFNTTTGSLEMFNGTIWRDVVPSSFTASQISDPSNLNVGRINGSRFSVQETAPSSPAVNDIWFW